MEALITPITLDYFTQRTLTGKSGLEPQWWPEMVAKELLDNAIDAAESAGVVPDVKLVVRPEYIAVEDNGGGIPPEVLAGAFDFTVRASTKAKRISPTRGSQGEALMQLAAVPVVLDGERGRLEIGTRGELHTVDIRLDQIENRPVVTVANGRPFVRNGTSVKVCWPELATQPLTDDRNQFLQIATCYAVFNPHLSLTCDVLGDVTEFPATDPGWQHWPAGRSSPWWWTSEDLRVYLSALIARDRQRDEDRTVREVVATFEGLAGSAKQKRVLDETGLARAKLSSFVSGGELDDKRVRHLLEAIQEHSAPVKPQRLGVLGRDHLSRCLGDVSGPEYAVKRGVDDGRPYIAEVAFGHVPDLDGAEVSIGINWSPSADGNLLGVVGNEPFDSLLAERYCSHDEPVRMIVHVATPRVPWSTQGKTRVSFRGDIGAAIADAVKTATKAWHKYRRSVDRQSERRVRAFEAMERPPAPRPLKSVIFELLPELVEELRGNDQWGYSHRHLYYVVRKRVQDFTDKPLNSAMFEAITKEYEERHGDIPGCYREARGYLIEPHTGNQIQLGTKQVASYTPPLHLYDKLLFVEKRAIWPIIEQMRIAERYDMAVVCSEGFAVRACRSLLGSLQREKAVTIACVHDADPAGYLIDHRLRTATKRSPFDIRIADFGLSVEEAVELGAEGETFVRRKALPAVLEGSLAGTAAEWFRGRKLPGSHKAWECRRVELNEIPPQQFAQWLERKVRDHGMDTKLVPPDDVVRDRVVETYQDKLRQQVRSYIESQLDVDTMVERAVANLPEANTQRVVASMSKWAKAMPESRWTEHVETTVADQLGRRSRTILQAADAAMEGNL